MKRVLSDRLLRSLAQPHAEPDEVWDLSLRGFGCRKTSKQGTVSFFVLKRPRGRRDRVRLTLGSYPVLGLAEARTRARDALRSLQDGIDPREQAAEEARREAAKQASTFAAVAETFIARHVASKRTARNIEAIVRRELIGRWSNRPITDIRRADVIALIDEIVDRGHPEAARQVFAYTRRLFGWAVGRGLLEHSPADHFSAKDLIGAKSFRRRVLNEREIALLWRATEGPEASYFGPYARLLVLVGVRRTELGRAAWLEFDLDNATWTIPLGRMKSAEPHIVPLPPVAVEILRRLPQERGYVIGGASPIHYSRAKRQLDARMTALNGGRAIPRWTWHDARRTFRTGLSSLKIAPHIAELAIAHGKRGLSRIYDQHEYDAELRHAFEAWAQKVMNIVEPPTGTVAPLLRQKV
jgi:integrase